VTAVGLRTALGALAAVLIAAACGDDVALTFYEVRYFVGADRMDVRELEVTVDYAGPGRLLTTPAGPADCISADGGPIAVDDTGHGVAKIAYRSLGIIESDDSGPGAFPRELFRCSFVVAGVAPEEYFDALVTAARDTNSNDVRLPRLDTRVRAVAAPGPSPPPIPGDADDYDVTLSVINDAGFIGALQFDVTHSGDGAGWRGSGARVHCSWHIDGALTACNDVGNGRVRCAIAAVSGFATPTELVTCVLASAEVPRPQDFRVVVVDASDPKFQAADVEIAVTGIDPGDAGDPDPDGEPSDSVDYEITASITESVGAVGALQFDLVHLEEQGGWRGVHGSAECTWHVGDGAITACNDVGGGKLRCAAADVVGFDTPTEVVTCLLASPVAPSTGSFAVVVVDASDPVFRPLTVEMSVTAVRTHRSDVADRR